MIGITNATLNCDIEYPVLENPATAANIQNGKQAINSEGNIITGTYIEKTLPSLSLPAAAADIMNGKQAFDESGLILTGTHNDRSTVTLTIPSNMGIGFRKGTGSFFTKVTINIGDSYRMEVYSTSIRQGDSFNITVS